MLRLELAIFVAKLASPPQLHVDPELRPPKEASFIKLFRLFAAQLLLL